MNNILKADFSKKDMDFSKYDMSNGRFYFLNHDTKCLKLPLTIPWEEILEEAKALKDQFIPYRVKDGDGYAHKGWKSLPLHGLGDDKPMAWTAYTQYKNGREASKDYRWTSFSEKCPATVNWLKNVFPSNIYGRVRFMLLEAGGFIGPHSDTDIPVVEPVNIALSNHPNCVWRWEDADEELHFKPGDMYAMNIAHTHAVYNNSDEDRYHIIVHHHDSTPEWCDMMKKCFEDKNEEYEIRYSEELM